MDATRTVPAAALRFDAAPMAFAARAWMIRGRISGHVNGAILGHSPESNGAAASSRPEDSSSHAASP